MAKAPEAPSRHGVLKKPDCLARGGAAAAARCAAAPGAFGCFGMGGGRTDHDLVALRRRRQVVELVRYPREGHELTRGGEPAHRADHMARTLEWLDRYCKNDPGA